MTHAMPNLRFFVTAALIMLGTISVLVTYARACLCDRCPNGFAISEAQLRFRRWLRSAKRLRLLVFRQEWALARGEYECVGGPLDGKVIKWYPNVAHFLSSGGVYRHEADYRLHYHVDAPSQAWQGDLE